MRITNRMMINNNMANIQVNKNNINDKENQLSTQKKINKPSDDPVVAIRALRLRSSLDQIDQYLTKNIADASSWLDTTDGALSEANSVLTDLYNYCVQGANDSYSSSERKTLTETLDKLKTAYYSEGDVDYAGRFLFTGYMTDTPLTYQSDEDASPADFTITQQLTRDNLETKKAYTNTYTNQDILNLDVKKDAASGDIINPDSEDVYRFRIAYKDVIPDAGAQISLNDGSTIACTSTNDSNAVPGPDDALFNAQTGEILLGDNAYKKLYNSDGFSFTYRKDNFIKGDLNPIMYYDCVDHNPDNDGMVYTKKNEDIEYNVNFSQKLKVNTEANDAFNIYLGRDIDDLSDKVKRVQDIETQLDQVEEMLGLNNYQDDDSQSKLNSIKDALTKEKELAKKDMTDSFEKGIALMQKYQQQTSLAKADVGNRTSRLELTKSRLTEQKTNFAELKSKNEDIDLEEVVVNYSSAQTVYNASLMAASKVVKQSLLDFL